MKKSNDNERGDLVTAHLLVSVGHSASKLLIFPLNPAARRNPRNEAQNGASGGITVPHDWPIQRFHSTLPASRSTDIGRKGPGGGIRRALVLRLARSKPSFNAEAGTTQLLYRFTLDSRLIVFLTRDSRASKGTVSNEDETMPKPVCHPLAAAFGALSLTLSGVVQPCPAMAQNARNSAPEITLHSTAVAPDSEVTGSHGTVGQSFADLVDLALASPVVVHAVIRRQMRLKPEASPGLAPGFARLYIEADTAALLVGPELGESLRFLADVPLDPDGKVPKLNKSQVLLFGNIVPGKPGELQLTRSDTMFGWNLDYEARIRAILTELVSSDAPPRITGLREALHVPGNLTGEGETQFFFATDSGKPVSISVVRRPGEPTRWGVSFGEIVDQAAEPPRPQTLAWYRLACSLPGEVPDRASISATNADKRAAAEDYALVLRELGPCTRKRPHL
jgi:hypothetical protein